MNTGEYTNLIQQYIDDKKLAWAPSTIRSEYHRLMGVAPYLTGDPNHLWFHIEKELKPYSRVTLWTRVTDFYQWGIDNGKIEESKNKYRSFREKNQRLFKHCYSPKFPNLSYQEAKNQIEALGPSPTATLAQFLLSNGSRFQESRRCQEGKVTGKGNKVRTHYGQGISTEASEISYSRLRRALKTIGLKPHDLRKICASELVTRGLREADLCKVMGWESIATAKSYLIPKKDEELRKIFKEMVK